MADSSPVFSQDSILAVLKTIKYPGYSRDIVSFGIVKDIQIEGNAVGVMIELTTPNQDLGNQIADSVRLALRDRIEGLADAHVQVRVPTPQQAAASVPGAASRNKIPGINRIVAIASGKGGVGKSTCSNYLFKAFLNIFIGQFCCRFLIFFTNDNGTNHCT